MTIYIYIYIYIYIFTTYNIFRAHTHKDKIVNYRKQKITKTLEKNQHSCFERS